MAAVKKLKVPPQLLPPPLLFPCPSLLLPPLLLFPLLLFRPPGVCCPEGLTRRPLGSPLAVATAAAGKGRGEGEGEGKGKTQLKWRHEASEVTLINCEGFDCMRKFMDYNGHGTCFSLAGDPSGSPAGMQPVL